MTLTSAGLILRPAYPPHRLVLLIDAAFRVRLDPRLTRAFAIVSARRPDMDETNLVRAEIDPNEKRMDLYRWLDARGPIDLTDWTLRSAFDSCSRRVHASRFFRQFL